MTPRILIPQSYFDGSVAHKKMRALNPPQVKRPLYHEPPSMNRKQIIAPVAFADSGIQRCL